MGRGLLVVLLWSCGVLVGNAQSCNSPNFLLIVVDDLGWRNSSPYGEMVIETPHVQRLANEGVVFEQAFCDAPSCTPSRNAILTGKNIYELEHGSILNGPLPKKFTTYQDILEARGYKTGYTGKGAGPALPALAGRTKDPAGYAYNDAKQAAPEGISKNDYAQNLSRFLDKRQTNQPFSFWIGIEEPHVPYNTGDGARNGIACDQIQLPPYVPDEPSVREWVCDYLNEIVWLDKQLGRIMEVLAQRGELENTVIVFTSDNGIPLPRAKASVYEEGTRVPLIVRWPQALPGIRLTDYIPLRDIAPTFLEIAGIKQPDDMTGRSFLKSINSGVLSGRADATRDHVVVAFERHDSEDIRPTPARALYNDQYVYIYNFPPYNQAWEERFLPPAIDPALYESIKNTKNPYRLVTDFRTHPFIKPFWEDYRGYKEEKELFARNIDPYQLNNIASTEEGQQALPQLHEQLMAYTKTTADPRTRGLGAVLDTYVPYNNPWRESNPDSVAYNTKIISQYGLNIHDVLRPPAGAVKDLEFEGLADHGNIDGVITWTFPENMKDVTKIGFYWLNKNRRKVGKIEFICSKRLSYEINRSIPSNASYIGVVLANSKGESVNMGVIPIGNQVHVYPSVLEAGSQMNIWTHGYEGETAQLTMFSAVGQMMGTWEVSLEVNDLNKIGKVQIPQHFVSGYYIIKIMVGDKAFVKTIVVQ